MSHTFTVTDIEDMSIIQGALEECLDRVNEDYYGDSIEYYKKKYENIIEELEIAMKNYLNFAGAMDSLLKSRRYE